MSDAPLTEAQRVELMVRELRRTYDVAGRLLREKPERFVRWALRLARKRARLGLEAIQRGDLFEAGSLFGWSKDAMLMAAQHGTHAHLWPDAKRGRPFRKPKAGRRARNRDKQVRDEEIVTLAQRVLKLPNGRGRFQSGGINRSDLADAVMEITALGLKKTRIMQIIDGAIRAKK